MNHIYSRRQLARLALGCCAFLAWPRSGFAMRDVVAEYPWMADWVARGDFDRQWLNNLLKGYESDNRVIRLMDVQAEAKPYHQYRKLFLTRSAVNRGREMGVRHRSVFKQVESRFGAPTEIILALWWIESRYGRSMGTFSVLRTLFTLAANYPRRGAFFQDQLREYLLLCREEGWNPEAVKGSFAGAMAQVQMIPSTMRAFAVDFDGDGKRDVFRSSADVIASIGHFLQGHGWIPGGLYALPVEGNPRLAEMVSVSLDEMASWSSWQEKGVVLAGRGRQPDSFEPAALIVLEGEEGPRYSMVFTNFRVVTRWNRSRRFAMVVGELSEQLRHEIQVVLPS